MPERKPDKSAPVVGTFPRLNAASVAGVLLDTVTGIGNREASLTLRDMASLLDITPEAVHAALECLNKKGVIKMERQRLVVNKELLVMAAQSISKIC